MATPIGTEIHYDAAGGSSFTQAPAKLIEVTRTGAQTEKVPRGHLGATIRPTSPGGIEPGEMTLKFEVDTRVAADVDFFQLVLGWHANKTEGISWKRKFPKGTGITVNPAEIVHGYVSQEPVLPSPQQGRMEMDVVVTLTDLAAVTDGS